MPDPLLKMPSVETEFPAARRAALRAGADLARQGTLLVLRCQGPRGPVVGRFDCTGYPLVPPHVDFVDPAAGDPAAAPPSLDSAHWPASPVPFARDGVLHMCLAGTRSHAMLHGSTGGTYTLAELAVIVIRCIQVKVVHSPHVRRHAHALRNARR